MKVEEAREIGMKDFYFILLCLVALFEASHSLLENGLYSITYVNVITQNSNFNYRILINAILYL